MFRIWVPNLRKQVQQWSTNLQLSASFTRLAEVGRLETPKSHCQYDTGQLFLHRVFGYRGVILFPWQARVYDRDSGAKPEDDDAQRATSLPSPASQSVRRSPHRRRPALDSTRLPSVTQRVSHSPELNAPSAATSPVGKDVKGKTHTYYQALIDSRDCPFVRAQTESVTFLGSRENSRSLYAIPGLDYVAHDDVMPYSTSERTPLFHELFDKFLEYEPDKVPPFAARETLRAWQQKNHPWLELSDVHRETTEGVRVTVIPFYMGCRDAGNNAVHWWRYCIRLENLGTQTVQLRERNWRIFSLSGTLETVRGRGVVGQEPVLTRHQPAFQYSSHVSLQAPSGHMWGTFRMTRQDGYSFDCRIPPFSLESKPEDEDGTVPA